MYLTNLHNVFEACSTRGQSTVATLVLLFLVLSASGIGELTGGGPATIREISLSEADDGSEFFIRLHSDAEIAWFSSKQHKVGSGITVSLLNSQLSERIQLSEAFGPVGAYTALEQSGKVVLDVTFTDPGIEATVRRAPENFDILLAMTGYVEMSSALAHAYGNDDGSNPVTQIVSLLSGAAENSKADSVVVESAAVTFNPSSPNSTYSGVIDSTAVVESLLTGDVPKAAGDSEPGLQLDRFPLPDSIRSADQSPTREPQVRNEEKAERRRDLFVPKKLSTAGPVLLPKAPDVAAVDASTAGDEKEMIAETEVVSDIERMFAASLGKKSNTSGAPASRTRLKPETGASVPSGPGSRWKLDTVVIDPGHGGWDEGAFGSGGTLEKDLALDLSRELGEMLTKRLGLNVVYTRTDDRFITLADRGRIANQSGAKLFLSIHANFSKSRSANGTETFFLGVHRSDSAKVVMERENEVVKLESDESHYAAYTSASLAQQALAQSSFMRHSEMLAEAIQSEFRESAVRRDRGVKQAGFYVLFGASMPAVLIELGFLSNPYEEKFLSSGTGQTTMANAIFDAVSKYKIEYERSLQVAEE